MGGRPCVSLSHTRHLMAERSRGAACDGEVIRECGLLREFDEFCEYTQICGTVDGLDIRRASQSTTTTKNGFEIDQSAGTERSTIHSLTAPAVPTSYFSHYTLPLLSGTVSSNPKFTSRPTRTVPLEKNGPQCWFV